MNAVGYRAAVELRRTLRSALGIALLVALLGGIVLAAVAGARRTAAAYPAMLERTAAPEIVVSPPGAPGADPTPFYDAVERLDGVRTVAVIAGMSYLPLAGSPAADLAAPGAEIIDLGILWGSIDGRFAYDLRRPVVTDGRMPALDALDEVLVSRQMSRRTGIGMGDVLDLVLVPGAAVGATPATADQGTVLHLEVVGIGTLANEVITFNDLDELGAMVPSPAVAALQDRRDWGFEGAFVDLEPGTDVAEVAARIRALGDDPSLGTGGPVFVSDETAHAADVQDGMRPIAVALAAFAVAVGAVSLVVVGQALARHTRPTAGDLLAMRAIGLGAGQRAAVPLARAFAIATTGAVGAVVVAVLLSPRFPIGPARVAESQPGLDVDAGALLLGAASTVAAVVGSLLPTALVRARRDRRRSPRLGRAVTSRAGAARLPPTIVQGIRLAFGADSDGSPASRSTITVAVVAVAAVLGTAAFASGLTELVDNPARYGQRWDRMLDASFAPVPAGMLVDELRDDERVAGLALGNYGELHVGGLDVPAVELTGVRGDAGVSIIEGEQADEPGEIVLGGEVLDDLGLVVGDEIAVDAGDRPSTHRVVGRAVFPRLGRGSFDGTGLGVGAQVAPGLLPIYDVEAMILDEGFDLGEFRHEGWYFAFLLVDVAGDPAALDLRLAELTAGYYAELRLELAPTTIRDLDRVRDVPRALAAVLALVAAAALAHQLVSSVRERRRELALLRTIGFSSRQLRATVVGTGVVLATFAALVGVPLGLAAGRAAWRLLASRMYVEGAVPAPWTWVAASLPVVAAVATVVALVPATRAARVRAASALREEVRG